MTDIQSIASRGRCYVITDGHGFFVRRRKGVALWSSLRKDAAEMHFRRVAELIAESLPMPVTIRLTPSTGAT